MGWSAIVEEEEEEEEEEDIPWREITFKGYVTWKLNILQDTTTDSFEYSPKIYRHQK
jgi:hypothetical protein